MKTLTMKNSIKILIVSAILAVSTVTVPTVAVAEHDKFGRNLIKDVLRNRHGINVTYGQAIAIHRNITKPSNGLLDEWVAHKRQNNPDALGGGNNRATADDVAALREKNARIQAFIDATRADIEHLQRAAEELESQNQ